MKKASELTLLLANAIDNTEEFLSVINRHVSQCTDRKPLKLVMLQKAKNDAFDLAERLQVFSKKDLIKVWEAGLNAVRKILEIIGTANTDEEVSTRFRNIIQYTIHHVHI